MLAPDLLFRRRWEGPGVEAPEPGCDAEFRFLMGEKRGEEILVIFSFLFFLSLTFLTEWPIEVRNHFQLYELPSGLTLIVFDPCPRPRNPTLWIFVMAFAIQPSLSLEKK